MSQAETFYEGHSFYEGLTWSSVRELIGQNLPERYQVPNELPAKLLALVKKLEAIDSKSPRARTLIGTLDAIEGLLEAPCATSGASQHGSKRRLVFVHLKLRSQGRLQ